MKKNEFWLPALFLATVLFLFVIPIGAFLVSEILGWGKEVYSVLTDLGSLIAGIIAVIGVAWMVYTQKSETTKTIKSNEGVMRNEAFEIQKSKALDSVLLMRANIYLLSRTAIVSNNLDYSDDAGQKLQEILKCTYQTSLFFNKSDEDIPYSLVIEYVNLYNALLINSQKIENLPNIVIGRLKNAESILGQASGTIFVDGTAYHGLDNFILRCGNDGAKMSFEEAVNIVKYSQLYIDAYIAPLIMYKVKDKQHQ